MTDEPMPEDLQEVVDATYELINAASAVVDNAWRSYIDGASAPSPYRVSSVVFERLRRAVTVFTDDS